MANTLTPTARASQVKTGYVARTDTTAKELFSIPKGAVISGIYVIGTVASDAATTATVSIGNTASANEYMNGFDVKTAATATGYQAAGAKAVGTAMMSPLASDILVKGIYAETGTASTTGGPWYVKVEYYLPPSGQTI